MKKLILSVLFIFISSISCFAATPLLLFSDIVDGPDTGIADTLGSGAIVTIWGQNLGSSQGTSTVTFTDSGTNELPAAHIYFWGNATGSGGGGPADLYTYHKMQEISFSIPDSDQGAGTIHVTVGGVNSNDLVFTVRSGSVFWVASSPSGDDGNAGTYAAPWETLNYACATSRASGSIIYVKDGVIADGGDVTFGFKLQNNEGSIGSRYAVIAYPGATVITKGNTGGYLFMGQVRDIGLLVKYELRREMVVLVSGQIGLDEL